MELADVTDSKSVGSNTVRVRPPPSAPKIAPRSTSGENPQLAGKARMPYKMNAQSFARCETNRAFINVQRMHDDGRTKPLHDATAQMAVDAQMWQPKRLTRHERLQATTYTIFIQRVDKLQQYIAKSV